MADTWHISAQAVTYAANKYMLDVFNGSSSAKSIDVYRIWFFNNQTSAITGVFNTLQIHRTSAASAGTTVTPVAHNTANASLDANTSAGYGRTVTTGSLFRQLLTSPDEPTLSTLDWDSAHCLVPFAEIWNSGYGDSNVQPLRCRTGQAEGISLKSVNQTVGSGDFEMEFTNV